MRIALPGNQFNKNNSVSKASTPMWNILQFSFIALGKKDSVGTNLHIDFTPLPLPPLAEEWLESDQFQ